MPAVIIEERIRRKLHILDAGQQIEKWVAGRCHQHFVSGIAKQAEEKRIYLARAGGQNDLLGRNARAALGIVARNGFARRKQSLRFRFISQGFRRSECLQNPGFVVVESDLSGIGGGEIEDPSLRLLCMLERCGKPIRLKVPLRAAGEHSTELYTTHAGGNSGCKLSCYS